MVSFLYVLPFLTLTSAQLLSTNHTTRGECRKLSNIANANATDSGYISVADDPQDLSINGLGQWHIAIHTNHTAHAFETNSTSSSTSRDPNQSPDTLPLADDSNYDAVARLWLDPYRDIDLGSGSNAYSACAFIFKGLPLNTILRAQTSDSATCDATLSTDCISDLIHLADTTAFDLTTNFTPAPNSNLTSLSSICAAISTALSSNDSFPSSCGPYLALPETVKSFTPNTSLPLFTGPNPSSSLTLDTLLLTSNTTNHTFSSSCTFPTSPLNPNSTTTSAHNAPPGLAYPLTTTSLRLRTSNPSAVYDALVQNVWPILTVTFPPANASSVTRVGQAQSWMTCLRARNVTEGSYIPPALPKATRVSSKRRGLGGGAIAGVVVGVVVGVGLVLGAGVWWFARGKRRSREMHGMRIGEGRRLGGVGVGSRSRDVISEEDPNARINRYAELGGTSIDEPALEGDSRTGGGEDRRDGHTRLPADIEGSQGLPGFYGRA